MNLLGLILHILYFKKVVFNNCEGVFFTPNGGIDDDLVPGPIMYAVCAEQLLLSFYCPALGSLVPGKCNQCDCEKTFVGNLTMHVKTRHTVKKKKRGNNVCSALSGNCPLQLLLSRPGSHAFGVITRRV